MSCSLQNILTRSMRMSAVTIMPYGRAKKRGGGRPRQASVRRLVIRSGGTTTGPASEIKRNPARIPLLIGDSTETAWLLPSRLLPVLQYLRRELRGGLETWRVLIQMVIFFWPCWGRSPCQGQKLIVTHHRHPLVLHELAPHKRNANLRQDKIRTARIEMFVQVYVVVGMSSVQDTTVKILVDTLKYGAGTSGQCSLDCSWERVVLTLFLLRIDRSPR